MLVLWSDLPRLRFRLLSFMNTADINFAPFEQVSQSPKKLMLHFQLTFAVYAGIGVPVRVPSVVRQDEGIDVGTGKGVLVVFAAVDIIVVVVMLSYLLRSSPLMRQ